MKARMSPRIPSLLVLAALLSACGGGSSHDASVNLPTASISYLQDAGLVVGAPTPPLRPDIAGQVTGDFMISPSLPAGLKIDPDLGNIYGIPTAPAPTTVYTVTAASPEGRIKTTVRFTVRDVTPNISYSPSARSLTQDVPLPENITPSNSGGVVVSWSINPALPAGLAFDMASGTISGTPTAASPQTNYQITASNSGGTSSATLTLTVQAASGFGGLTIRSEARLEATQSVGVAGKTSVVQSSSWLMVFQGSAPLSNIEIPAAARWWRLAADGSYVVAATDAKLIVWSPAGVLLFTKSAHYGDAHVFAAAGELRVAAGPAGPHVIESIALPTGVARVSAVFQGSFLSWSEDGDRFIAGLDDAMFTYSHDAGRFADTGLTTAPLH
jgi:hypothetical protein